MKGKKRIMLLLLLCATGVLVAWKIKPVELIDDKFLIDLDVAIQDADWGQEDSSEDESNHSSEDNQNPDMNPVKQPEEKAEITVLIRGERCYLNNVDMKTMSALEKYLSQRCSEETRVYLVDDYAEAHVYRQVHEYLRQLQAETAFEISEVMTEG